LRACPAPPSDSSKSRLHSSQKQLSVQKPEFVRTAHLAAAKI
jgi:hypothetical protein